MLKVIIDWMNNPSIFCNQTYNKMQKGGSLMGNYGNNDYGNNGKSNSSSFAFIVVLFVLLIIVGASFIY